MTNGSSSNLSRRNFVQLTAAGAAAGAAGCVGGGDGDDTISDSVGRDSDSLDDGERPVEWIGPDWAVADAQANKFTEMTDVDINTTIATIGDTQAQILGGGSTNIDVVTTDTSGSAAMTRDNPVTLPMAVDDLENWNEDNVSDLFTDPESALGHLDEQVETFTRELWADGDAKDELLFSPYAYNFDAMGYNPSYVDDVSLWSALFDDQYSGEVIVGETAAITIPQTMMHLLDNDMIDANIGELNDPSQDQLDTAIDFLVEQKEAGQFRSTWEAYGESVTLMAGEEAVIGDVWQPAAMDVRRDGTPCTYATMSDGVQGYRFWYGGMSILEGAAERDNVAEAYSLYDDVHMGAWFPGFVQQRGYSVPHYENRELVRDGSDDSGEGMGPEYYDWAYEGESTYEPVDEPALFDPAEYDWSMEEGEPDSNGGTRDSGPIEERINRIGFFQIWPSEADYMTQRWEEFLSA
ncbi:extracellular solute-binding protein [Natrinema versiforme]|uniref:Spermidine/putrescine ABC transporter substrate-binding protein n=1 Tax=Natrinema versiforme JCM 10478 TaxID=1227496 RepID=L9XVT9_9EURY|nr:extracellular solute-binding protein [Natrinema versiforme]ELY65516.1 spermidine/putrescine ABC transporter substrate-binding protein [Natrinema versiforme JCM 10478]